jgi:hypothetical protein
VEKIGQYDFKPGGAITGTRDYPIRFNAKGELCDKYMGDNCPAPQWPIQATTEVNFVCPPYFSNAYNSTRGGVGFYQELYTAGITVMPTCPKPGEVRVRLTIQESVDPGGSAVGLFKPIVEVFKVPASKIKARVDFEI